MEFPEARIYEEAMNILLYEGSTHSVCTNCSQSGAADIAVLESATSSAMSSPTFEQEQHRVYSEKVDKARRDLKQN